MVSKVESFKKELRKGITGSTAYTFTITLAKSFDVSKSVVLINGGTYFTYTDDNGIYERYYKGTWTAELTGSNTVTVKFCRKGNSWGNQYTLCIDGTVVEFN